MKSDLARAFSRARSGSEQDFISLVGRYESLVFGYFRTVAPERLTESMNATQQVFFRLWENLGRMSRLTDFERELVAELAGRDSRPVSAPADRRLAALAQLSPRDRVVALAVEIGNWTVDDAARAFEVSRPRMEQDLLRIRCDLIGVHFINLSEDEKRVLREVSTHLCRDLSKKQRKRIAEATCRSPQLREFKARCLEKRCEMVELWLDFRLSAEEEEWLREGILDLVRRAREQRLALPGPGIRWLQPLRRRKRLPAS